MPYDIPVSGSWTSFFSDVNTLVGNNIPVFGTMIMIFMISLIGASGSGRRFEVCLAFASWVTAVSSYLLVVVFGADASLSVIPTVIAVLSLFLLEITKP